MFDQTGNGLDGAIMGGPQWVDGFTISGNLGDVNFDENLNIYDAVMLVAIMLGNEDGTDLQLNACDTNQDGIIDIEDVVLLFQWILEIDFSSRSILTGGYYKAYDKHIIISSDGEIAGFEISLTGSSTLQTLELPQGWLWSRNLNKVIAYSTDGSPLPNDFSFILDSEESVSNIKLVGWENSVIEAKKYIVPSTFSLSTYPNPFNPKCAISFHVSNESKIKVDIYNSKGQFMETLINKVFYKGNQTIYWQPKVYSSGIYFIQVSDAVTSQNQKIIYLK